jgi:hypothetical protein
MTAVQTVRPTVRPFEKLFHLVFGSLPFPLHARRLGNGASGAYVQELGKESERRNVGEEAHGFPFFGWYDLS